VKKMGEERALELKNYTYEKVNSALAAPYAQAVRKSMDSAMDLTEQAVDHFLPAVDDEPQQEQSDEHNVVQRMSSLSDKMRRRVSRRGMVHYQAIQKRSEGAIQRLTQSVDLIQAAKNLEVVGRERVSSISTAVQTKATWLWSELSKEEESQVAGDEPKSIEQRLLSVARVATHEAIAQYKRLTDLSTMLPASFHNSLDMSTHYAMELYHQLLSATTLKDVSDMTLKQMSAGLETMQALVSEIFSSLRGSVPAAGDAQAPQ